jgi:hypothetical protein
MMYNIKYTSGQRAKIIYNFMNTKKKLLKTRMQRYGLMNCVGDYKLFVQ